jgi:hypothetical protein
MRARFMLPCVEIVATRRFPNAEWRIAHGKPGLEGETRGPNGAVIALAGSN